MRLIVLMNILKKKTKWKRRKITDLSKHRWLLKGRRKVLNSFESKIFPIGK